MQEPEADSRQCRDPRNNKYNSRLKMPLELMRFPTAVCYFFFVFFTITFMDIFVPFGMFIIILVVPFFFAFILPFLLIVAIFLFLDRNVSA